MKLSQHEFERIRGEFDAVPSRSSSLHADCYTDARFVEIERQAIFAQSWQFVCHAESLRNTGDYVSFEINDQPLLAVRDQSGKLRGFYNVCQHRAHELVAGSGNKQMLVCPYHGWSYRLDGMLHAARHTEHLENFDTSKICLKTVRVEEFCNLIFANLDTEVVPLSEQADVLGSELRSWAPDLDQLTHAHRIEYHIESNWKNVVDNFLECYHCPIAHKAFVDLFDMSTYAVTTHALHSSHIASAKAQDGNAAYDISAAEVRDHAVWWLWPNLCLLRYPGSGNLMVLNVIPTGPGTTRETYDFYFMQPEPDAQQWEAIEYVDKVLQQEDIDIVESIQRGMSTPAYEQGRFVVDEKGSGMSEHGVHHFHKLVLDAYRSYTL